MTDLKIVIVNSDDIVNSVMSVPGWGIRLSKNCP